MASERSLSEAMKELRYALRLCLAERLLAFAFAVMPHPEKLELAQALLPVFHTWAERYDPDGK